MTEEGKKWKDASVTICHCPGSGGPIPTKDTMLCRDDMVGTRGMILYAAGHSATDLKKQGNVLCKVEVQHVYVKGKIPGHFVLYPRERK